MGKAEYGRVSDYRCLSVDTNSATLGLHPMLESIIPSDSDHSSIIKIPSHAHKRYQDIKYQLRKLMKRKRLPVARQGYEYRSLMQLPGIQISNAIDTSVSGSHDVVMASKAPRSEYTVS